MDYTDFFILSLISFAGWIVVGIRLMALCEASGVANGWLSFIPVANLTRWACLARSNPWLVLVWIVPVLGWIAGVILSFVWLSRISDATGTKSPWFIVYIAVQVVMIVQGGIVHGLIGWIIALALTVAAIYSLWMIFDPAKPIARASA